MLSRRQIANCWVCAVTAVAGVGSAQAQTPGVSGGITRKVLSSTDMPGGKLVCVQALVEIEPGAVVARHTHPGIESSYVLEGTLTLSVKGSPDRTLRAGDGFQVPAEVPHGGQNGGQKTKLIATFTVEKDKPLASPAPA